MTNFDHLHRSLLKKHKKVKKDFEKKQLNAVKWLSSKNLTLADVYNSTTRLLTTGTLAGTLLLSGSIQAPGLGSVKAPTSIRAQLSTDEFNKRLAEKLLAMVPENIGKIQGEKEQEICDFLKDYLGFNVCFNLNGNILNYQYAWTGYEQHLYRYPGDTLEQHDEELQAGIAPGLGAWGYFSGSKEEMTYEDYMREKYYVAVQTLYLPEWQMDSQRIYEWYKYRKVVMVNPENGKACVAVVGDAGPAKWTGKQFGGSPELMRALDLHDNYRKGKVLLLFVDDPDNKIPLGPVEAEGGQLLAEK